MSLLKLFKQSSVNDFVKTIDDQIVKELEDRYYAEDGIRNMIINKFKQSSIKEDITNVVITNSKKASDNLKSLTYIELSDRCLNKLKSLIKHDPEFSNMYVYINTTTSTYKYEVQNGHEYRGWRYVPKYVTKEDSVTYTYIRLERKID